MKIYKKLFGILLAFALISSSFGIKTSAAAAKTCSHSAYYCETYNTNLHRYVCSNCGYVKSYDSHHKSIWGNFCQDCGWSGF